MKAEQVRRTVRRPASGNSMRRAYRLSLRETNPMQIHLPRPTEAPSDGSRLPEPLRILHLVHWMNRGGIETWLLNVVQRVRPGRCRMDICCKGPREGELASAVRHAGARVLLCPLGPTIVPFVQRLRRTLLRGRYDLLHVHTDAHAGPAVYAAASAGVPVVTTFHSTQFPPETRLTQSFGIRALRTWYTRHSMRYAVDHSDRATAVSRGAAAAVVDHAQAIGRTCAVLHLGVPEPRRLSPQAIADLRAGLRLSSHEKVVLHVGSLTVRKNHAALIDAFSRIHRECPEARLVLAGDGPLRHSVAARVCERGLSGQVRMLGVRTDVTDLMQAAEVLVFPSISEGLSLALMEASAVGLPVIASDIPGNREATADGTTARLHDVRDVAGMAASAVAVLRRPDVAAEMVEAARNAYEKRFSISASIARLMDLYGEVLQGRAARGGDGRRAA